MPPISRRGAPMATGRAYVACFLADASWKPRWTATFSGALRYTRYGLVTRWVMKMISRATGGPTDTSRDYDFTDWDAVERFGAQLARELGSTEAARADTRRLEPHPAS
jgi:menaquinone-dependent protoporphyrinogen oxidase